MPSFCLDKNVNTDRAARKMVQRIHTGPLSFGLQNLPVAQQVACPDRASSKSLAISSGVSCMPLLNHSSIQPYSP